MLRTKSRGDMHTKEQRADEAVRRPHMPFAQSPTCLVRGPRKTPIPTSGNITRQEKNETNFPARGVVFTAAVIRATYLVSPYRMIPPRCKARSAIRYAQETNLARTRRPEMLSTSR
jgi:hypothetical protein